MTALPRPALLAGRRKGYAAAYWRGRQNAAKMPLIPMSSIVTTRVGSHQLNLSGTSPGGARGSLEARSPGTTTRCWRYFMPVIEMLLTRYRCSTRKTMMQGITLMNAEAMSS